VVTAFPDAQEPSQVSRAGGIRLSMLPGFRFLFAAIVLSISILVFGLGAAALLRAAHEEFASTPSWRAAPEPVFAQQNEAARPVLAMLRVEPPPAEQKASDVAPARAAPDATPAEQAAIDPAPAEPEKVDAVKPEESSPPEMAKPEIPAESPAQGEAVPATADAPVAASEAKVAAIEEVLSSANDAGPIASEQASAPAIPEADAASTKIATPGDAPVAAETPPDTKAASTKPDNKSVIKKRRQARQAARRRMIAQRAQLAQQAFQQLNNPFAQPVTPDRRR
jgi:hypothetical protein